MRLGLRWLVLAGLTLCAGLLPPAVAEATEPGRIFYAQYNCARCGVRPDVPPLAGLSAARIEDYVQRFPGNPKHDDVFIGCGAPPVIGELREIAPHLSGLPSTRP